MFLNEITKKVRLEKTPKGAPVGIITPELLCELPNPGNPGGGGNAGTGLGCYPNPDTPKP